MRGLIIFGIVTLAACSAADMDIGEDIKALTNTQDCLCQRLVQKEADCGPNNVIVEYLQPWEVITIPTNECEEDWFIEDSFTNQNGCLISYYSNGECLNP